MFQKFKLLTTSHIIYLIFNCFEVRSLDFWNIFSVQIPKGFLMVFICSPPWILYSNLPQIIHLFNPELFDLPSSFQFSRFSPISRTNNQLKKLSISSKPFILDVSFPSKQLCKETQFKKQKTTFKKPIKEQQILTETLRFSKNKINKKKNCQKHQWKFSWP
jgi:hypothetical protein